MGIERTLSIIKPDATSRNITGQIIARLEAAGLRVIAQKRVWWKKKDAKQFYDIHKGQPFFKDLIVFMTSGPIVLQASNQSSASHRLTLEGPRVKQTLGPINPQDTATLKVTMTPGEYSLSADGSTGVEPAKLTVGAARPSAQNELLQP